MKKFKTKLEAKKYLFTLPKSGYQIFKNEDARIYKYWVTTYLGWLNGF